MRTRSRRALQSCAAALALALVSAGTAVSAGPLPRLTGRPLAAPTHLRLVISGAPPYLLDLDSGELRDIAGLGSASVTASRQAAFASVDQGCRSCAAPIAGYRIRADGTVQRLATGRSLVPSHDSAATWALRRAFGDGCGLRLQPSSRPMVRVPCGFLEQDSAAGMLESTATAEILIDTRTGRVLARAPRHAPLRGSLVLEQAGGPPSENDG